MDLIDRLEKVNIESAELEQKRWHGTFREFLKLFKSSEYPNLGVLSHRRIDNMIRDTGVTNEELFGVQRKHYEFFEQDLYGIEDSIDAVMSYIHSAAQRTETAKRMLLLYGPTSSGKSQLIILMKKGLEKYSRTKDGAVFAVGESKMHENPFLLVPDDLRPEFEKVYGLSIEGELSPHTRYRLEDEFKGRFMDFPIEQIYLSEAARVGIGTWIPQDSKSSDQSELIGSIDFARIQNYGSESDPRVYNFDGELNVANRGLMEFIEGLRADERFLRVLLTATQEKSIKAPRFGLIYTDTFIIIHSIHPDEMIPIRRDGMIQLGRIGDFLIPSPKLETSGGCYECCPDGLIEVMSIDMRTRQPQWKKVKKFLCHAYSGKVLRLQQKYGDIRVSPNHSVYDRNYELFDAEEHSSHDLLTIPYVPQDRVVESVNVRELTDREGFANIEWVNINTEGEDNQGLLIYSDKGRKSKVGVVSSITSERMPAFLRILAAYIAEGHLAGSKEHPTGFIVSQNNVAWLSSLSSDVKLLSVGSGRVGYINDRSDSDDKTSRLEVHSIVWAEVIKRLCGRYGGSKRIPDFIFNLSYDNKMLFLNALIEGDGNRSQIQKYYDHPLSDEYLENYFSYITTSRELASGFSLLCKLCGINISINSRQVTKANKTIYRIGYVKTHRIENKKTAEEEDFKGYLYDIEVDDPHSHNFACGVGLACCHNTNETEFINFMAEKKYEAYHDRMVIIRIPYNLGIKNEVRIYKKLLTNSDALKNMHIAPRTLEAAAMFAVLSRLEPGDNGDLSLIKKMKLYDGQDVKGFKSEQVPDIKKKSPREGMTGVSPRFVIDQISAAISKARDNEDQDFITALDVLRQLNNGVRIRDNFTKEQKNKFEEYIDMARTEWNDLLRDDIQKAFFLSFDDEARNLCSNYIDQIEAACSGQNPRDAVTGEEKELDEKLMDAIEEHIDISSSGKEDFRNEILRYDRAAEKKNKKFDYTQHAQLKEAIQKQLFVERQGTIRMTVSSRNPDPEALRRLNEVIDRMVEQQGYTAASVNELLKYATAHLFDK